MAHVPVEQSCAVVGNSGNLKFTHFGDTINSHTLVLRTNQVRARMNPLLPASSSRPDFL